MTTPAFFFGGSEGFFDADDESTCQSTTWATAETLQTKRALGRLLAGTEACHRKKSTHSRPTPPNLKLRNLAPEAAGDHPWQAAQRAERRRGLRAQGLAPGTPHGGAGGAAGETTSGGLAGRPGGPILQLSDETHFLDPEGHWVAPGPRWRRSCASA